LENSGIITPFAAPYSPKALEGEKIFLTSVENKSDKDLGEVLEIYKQFQMKIGSNRKIFFGESINFCHSLESLLQLKKDTAPARAYIGVFKKLLDWEKSQFIAQSCLLPEQIPSIYRLTRQHALKEIVLRQKKCVEMAQNYPEDEDNSAQEAYELQEEASEINGPKDELELALTQQTLVNEVAERILEEEISNITQNM